MFKQIHFAIFPTEGLTHKYLPFQCYILHRRVTVQRNSWSMLNKHHPRSYLKISQCRTSRTYRITNNWPIENSHKKEISHRKNQIHFLYIRSCQLSLKCRKVGILVNFVGGLKMAPRECPNKNIHAKNIWSSSRLQTDLGSFSQRRHKT